jgi:ABC-type amino acid transport substrate-binding protein
MRAVRRSRPLAALLALALACAGPRAVADLAEVKASGTPRVLAGHDENWFSLAPSEAPGFEREVLEGFAPLNDLRFETVAIERWDEPIPMLVSGRGDLLAGVKP